MFKNFSKFYFLGIGGISMSALALILQSKGCEVKGSDERLSSITDGLLQTGIEVVQGGCAEFVCWADCIVCTSAIADDNDDLLLAKKLGKKVISRAQLLGEISADKRAISIAGTHGKTTTTGMISSILLQAHLDPTIHIGGILKNIGGNLRIGEGEHFITEACEYKDAFLSLSNHISVVLNIENDHLDYFKNFDNICSSFNKFIKNTAKNGLIVYNFDNCCEKLDKNILKQHNCISFGLTKEGDLRAENIKESLQGISFEVVYYSQNLGEVFVPCVGRHNVYNALASIGVGLWLGIDFAVVKQGLKNYMGVERRMDIVSVSPYIIHDYAHHPQEIEATLGAISKSGFEKKICIFQPHTFSRTRALYSQFLNCFSSCDEVWLLPIYPAREKPIKGVTSFNLYKDLRKNRIKARYFASFSRCYDEIIKNSDKNFMYAILGAGDIEGLAKMFAPQD